ncbi:hypothetical protein [Aureibacter tunicatorum]|uniref:Lipocalin-like domain-containing protein n=1 Tax=Aureibacter tunicatorum TaxID=866807 RepID=A0AAE3XTS2_9BACT|nr:hypothetical protein [Aureibacter tunicatorum]MDR6241534.1 hypothetical protein [Aureibacter tunicatorum]
MKKTILLNLMLSLTLLFGACNNDENENDKTSHPLVGEWNLIAGTVGETTIETKSLLEMELLINENNTFSMKGSVNNVSQPDITGNWEEVENNKFKFTMSGLSDTSLDGSLVDNQLRLKAMPTEEGNDDNVFDMIEYFIFEKM